MAGDVIQVGDTDFQREVLEAKEPVLVDFTATWCPPCRFIAPIVDALATEYKGRMKVAKLDVDLHQTSAQEYGVRSLPTLLLFKEGKVVKQLVGAAPRAKIEETLRPFI